MHLQYGRDGLEVELPAGARPRHRADLRAGAARRGGRLRGRGPRIRIGGRPLRECVAAHERVAIVIPDITRPLPTDRLLPWIFAELAHVPAENFTIINGTGSHRVNTPDELRGDGGRRGARPATGW